LPLLIGPNAAGVCELLHTMAAGLQILLLTGK
jgi:hypothetical protein